MALNHKQKKFYDEYLKSLNATTAAKKAGYSKKTAYSIGQRLLKNVEGRQFMAEKGQKFIIQNTITQERVLQEMARLAYGDIRRLYNEDGTLKQITDLDDDAAATIAGVEVDEKWEWDDDGKKHIKTGLTKKLKRHDKTKALEMLGRYLKLFGAELPPSNNVIHVHIDK